MRGALVLLSTISIVAVLVVTALTGRWPPVPGRLPGDIRIEGQSGSFYFPITTCLLISLLLTLALNLWLRWFRGGR
ncbi:MAG: DUF2905 domain-containing protein [Kiritimatiellae bacterium]|nr:DUF2905 domain-containing protein [Kiritimatiellia bacterium]